MNFLYICAIVIICSIASLVLKENKSTSMSMLVCTVGIVVVIGTSILGIAGNIKEFNGLVSSEIPTKYSSVIIKSFGISIVCETSSDILCEMGSERLSRSLEFAGKVEMLLLVLPQINELIRITKQYL